jgi:hypothetical protein
MNFLIPQENYEERAQRIESPVLSAKKHQGTSLHSRNNYNPPYCTNERLFWLKPGMGENSSCIPGAPVTSPARPCFILNKTAIPPPGRKYRNRRKQQS